MQLLQNGIGIYSNTLSIDLLGKEKIGENDGKNKYISDPENQLSANQIIYFLPIAYIDNKDNILVGQSIGEEMNLTKMNTAKQSIFTYILYKI